MPHDMHGLMTTLPETEPDRLRLADSLRQQQYRNSLLAGSSDPLISSVGRSSETNTNSGIKALRSAIKNRRTERESRRRYDQGFEADEAERKFRRERDTKRDRLLHESRMAKSTGFVKPTGMALKGFNRGKALVTAMNEANQMYDAFTPKQKDMLNKPVTDVATGFLPEGAERLLQEKVLYPDPAVRKYRTLIANVESDISHHQFGTQQTVFEMAQRRTWSPFAPGLNPESRNDRINTIQNKLTTEGTIFKQTYGDRFGDMPAIIPVTPPEVPAVQTLAAPAAQAAQAAQAPVVDVQAEDARIAQLQALAAQPAPGPTPAPVSMESQQRLSSFQRELGQQGGGSPADRLRSFQSTMRQRGVR